MELGSPIMSFWGQRGAVSACWGTAEGKTPRTPYLDDHKALGVAGHAGELGDQLTELGPALGVDHPAWGRAECREGGGGVLATVSPCPPTHISP